ncbi:MAG TPA: hypothetical protein VFC02_15840 [Anaerolineales bacterium]|jgi:hypothetical protein|nr:hypothetical protein [Anaerolineales bacterium]
MQEQKYFGLTTKQIGILAGLAGAACLIFGLVGWSVFRRGFSRAPADTPVVVSTSTPFVIPTITPTAIPTPVPYEQLIPEGWVQHRTALVELWLPSAFENSGQGISGISGNSVLLEMALTGKASSTSANKIFVSVSFEPLSADSLEAFLESRLSNIPVEVNLTERRKVLINSTEAYRLMFESNNNNILTNDLLFVILDGTTLWYVRYSAQINDFYEMLPAFEQSIKTFRIVR